MTSRTDNNIKYKISIEGLCFFDVKDNVFHNEKTGKDYPWRQLIAIDMLGDPLKITLDKDCEVPDITANTPVVIQTHVDRFGNERVHQIIPA
jgi:hypothetical protein